MSLKVTSGSRYFIKAAAMNNQAMADSFMISVEMAQSPVDRGSFWHR